MGFSLELYPVAYRASFQANGSWAEEYIEKDGVRPQDTTSLSEAEKTALYTQRNCWADMPLINYSSQYALSCFEGLKALPQKGGGLAIFRPDQNAKRFRRSMEGLLMPGLPEEAFVKSAVEVVRRNAKLGWAPAYDKAWEAEDYASATSIYIRPFTSAEGGIGVNASHFPMVVTVCTPVSAYFAGGSSKATTTQRVRSMPHGTGWIKSASNYVMSMLAKKEAEQTGFMEVIFLDGKEETYIEEGSSCNFFILLKSGVLVTPALGDTILPGITRASLIELARDMGVKVEERRISIQEAMEEGKECFVSGTAAGVTPLESITHLGKEAVFNGRKPGELSLQLRKTLKGIQYGALPDAKGWMAKV